MKETEIQLPVFAVGPAQPYFLSPAHGHPHVALPEPRAFRVSVSLALSDGFESRFVARSRFPPRAVIKEKQNIYNLVITIVFIAKYV